MMDMKKHIVKASKTIQMKVKIAQSQKKKVKKRVRKPKKKINKRRNKSLLLKRNR